MTKNLLFIFFTLFVIHCGNAQNIKGSILDLNSGEGLPFAKIYCIETQNGAIADSNGNWELENVINNQMTLQISASEYESKMIEVDNPNTDIIVELELAHIHLDEVIISTSDSKLQRYSTFPIDSRKIADLNKIENTNLVDALSNMPGIYNQSTGNGIAKPVIRGLSGMRVLTSLNGLRIENQQWGADHGFALFNLGIDRVEVIKGPSSLIYGADALGGVIYVADEPYANANESELKMSSKFETNSLATVNNISYKSSKNKLRFTVYGGCFNRADYGIPGNQFVSNSKNSGGSVKTAIGYNKKNWITNFRYQLLSFRIGLPGHTHDVNPDVSSFLSDNQSRSYNIPAQHITNHLAQWENKIYFKNDELVAQLGFTYNELKEYGEKVTVPGVDMTLQNYSYNLRWKHQFNKHFELVSGSQGMFQSNTNGRYAEEVLVPNADFVDLGAFSLIKGTFNIWNIQAGARYDQRSITTLESVDPFAKTFSGVNYSAGISRSSKNFTTRLNASSGFRPPHVSELLANGVHHGTMQYLIGDVNLDSERANQIDFYFGSHFDHIEIVINPFINQINNFVFKDPTGNTDSTSGLPLFNIKQTDALLSGGDIAIHYHPHIAHWLHLESNFSLLSAQDISNNSLPFTPQNRINNIVKVDFNSDKNLKINSLSAQYVYFFEQNKVAIYEQTSDAYQLINLGCNGSLLTKHKIDFSFGVNNLLNVKYIDHLSRLKPYEIANPGRNFYIKLNFMISKS
ncbi:MAG: TonB-dependent receptor [Flavobacteriales bacterium]|nr:TonB-dependent receptor [Flavobacteriales bacterium]